MARFDIPVSQHTKKQSGWNELTRLPVIRLRGKDGLVAAKYALAPFGGEVVVWHTGRRFRHGPAASTNPSPHLYDGPGLPGAMLAIGDKTATAITQNRHTRLWLQQWQEQMGRYNFLSIEDLNRMADEAADFQAQFEGTRDYANVEAGQMLAIAAHPVDSLGRRNPGSKMAVATGVINRVDDRHHHMVTNVRPAAEFRLPWALDLMRSQSQHIGVICRHLLEEDSLQEAWPYLTPECLTVKPWTFLRNYLIHITRRDVGWPVEPDINRRLLEAVKFEGLQPQLRQVAKIAEKARSTSARKQAVEQIQQIIDRLRALQLPLGYSSPPDQRDGIADIVLISLERLKHRLLNNEPVANRKLETDRLRWILRYRALPTDRDTCELWHGPPGRRRPH